MDAGFSHAIVAATSAHIGARNGRGRNRARQTADKNLSNRKIHQPILLTRTSISDIRVASGMGICQLIFERNSVQMPKTITGTSSSGSPQRPCQELSAGKSWGQSGSTVFDAELRRSELAEVRGHKNHRANRDGAVLGRRVIHSQTKMKMNIAVAPSQKALSFSSG